MLVFEERGKPEYPGENLLKRDFIQEGVVRKGTLLKCSGEECSLVCTLVMVSSKLEALSLVTTHTREEVNMQ